MLLFTLLLLCQAAKRCSPPAPLSQTLVCPEPAPKELWSLRMLGRREKRLMASYQSSSTRERTSHLMRFYNHFSGKIASKIFFFCFTLVILLWVSLTSVLPPSVKCSSSEGRPFRLGTGANMEKVVKMDRDMTKVRFLKCWKKNCTQNLKAYIPNVKRSVSVALFKAPSLALLSYFKPSLEWKLWGDHRGSICCPEEGQQVGPVRSDS